MSARLFVLGCALGAAIFAWVFSGPGFVALINWDTGSYAGGIATGAIRWGSVPWNNHLGMGQEYLLFTWVARALGLTVVDGVRLGGAAAFAIAFAVVADTLRVLTRSLPLALGLALAWATAWVNFHYHLIVEDNFFFLAPAAMALRICLLRASDWRWRDSVACGLLVTLGFLGSWQALPYLAPPVWTALLAGRGWRRGRDALLVPAAFLGALVLWAALLAAASPLPAGRIFAVVFSRPQPSFLPGSLGELWRVIASGLFLDTVGTGVEYHLTFQAYHLGWRLPLGPVRLGLIAVALQAVLFAEATVRSWRARDLRLHLLAGMLLLFTVVTALHKDEASYAELKRFDFVPLYLALLAGVALGRARAPAWLRERALPVALCALAVAQVGLGLRWAERQRASYRTTQPWSETPHPPHMLYGREGRSWFAYFRELRARNPGACRFVFDARELESGGWNVDLTGSLWSELGRDHLALRTDAFAPRRPVETWRHPPLMADLAEARRRGLLQRCAWLSEDARRLVNPED